MRSKNGETIRLLVTAGLVYVRWTQIVPMIGAWIILLVGLLALSVVSFQEQAFALLEFLLGGWVRLGGPLTGTQGAPGEPVIHLSGDDLRRAAIWTWFGVSLLGSVADWLLRGRVRIPFLATLARRICTAAAAAAIVALGFIASYLWGSVPYNGSPWGWWLMFLGAPTLVWIISAYSLSVSWALGRVIDVLERSAIFV